MQQEMAENVLTNLRSDHPRLIADAARWGEPNPDKAVRKLAVHLTGINATTVRFVFTTGDSNPHIS